MLLLGLAVAVSACGGGGGSGSSSSSAPSSSAGGQSSATAPAPQETTTGSASGETGSAGGSGGSGNQWTVVASDEGGRFRFEPATLTVKPGEKVSLVVENKGPSPHDLAIPDLKIETGQLPAGESKTLEFQAPSSPGEYRIICTIPGHEQLGMKGTLVVAQ